MGTWGGATGNHSRGFATPPSQRQPRVAHKRHLRHSTPRRKNNSPQDYALPVQLCMFTPTERAQRLGECFRGLFVFVLFYSIRLLSLSHSSLGRAENFCTLMITILNSRVLALCIVFAFCSVFVLYHVCRYGSYLS